MDFELKEVSAILTLDLHIHMLEKFMTSPFISTAFSSVCAALVALGTVQLAVAQDSIFRCGNEYTNNATEAKAKGCKTLQGGNITVVQGTKPVAPPATSGTGAKVASSLPATAPPGAPKVDVNEQRNRDTGARAILEGELKRTENRQAELTRDYNNGEPEKSGGESRNYQKYLDRVAALKADMARNEEDIAGLKREMARLPGGK
jgi:hypothetical protein